jgi:hypothetical protein
MGASEKKPTGPHIKLSLWMRSTSRREAQNRGQVTSGILRRKKDGKSASNKTSRKLHSRRSTAVRKGSATMGFEHQKEGKPKKPFTPFPPERGEGRRLPNVQWPSS